MILYTYYVIDDKQNRSKQAQHHAVSFYFFLGKFDNMTNMSVLLRNYRDRVRTDNTIIFQQNKFHIWVDNQTLFHISTFDININWEEIFFFF